MPSLLISSASNVNQSLPIWKRPCKGQDPHIEPQNFGESTMYMLNRFCVVFMVFNDIFLWVSYT